MRNQIVKDKEFYILSRSIDNAQKCRVIEACSDCFKVKLSVIKKFETGESVELFAMTNKGRLYFETIVKDVQNDIVSIWFPISYKYLQKREYSRIKIDTYQEIILNDGKDGIKAKITDISAGGLKVEARQQPELLREYPVCFNIENREIKTVFEPVRIEAAANDFIISGRFKDINNYDRIALVQYCFGKQIENKNK